MKYNIPYPRLLNASLAEIRRIIPIRAAISLKMVPLSTATIELPEGENVPERSWMELFTCTGSAGIYRVCGCRTAYGGQSSTVNLEHGATEIGDYLVSAKYPPDEDTSSEMSVSAAVSMIWGYYSGTLWQFGTNAAIGNVDVNLSGENVLEALLRIMEQIPDYFLSFDQTTTPWTVSIIQKPTTVSAEGRLSRNIESVSIDTDTSDQVTRLYMDGLPSPGYIEADNIGTVGVIERYLSGGGDDLDAASIVKLQAAATKYVNAHKNPRRTIQISGRDFSDITGEMLDAMQICKKYRLALPDYGVTVEDIITTLQWRDVYNDPDGVTITLEEDENALNVTLSRLKKQNFGSSGGYARRIREEDEKFKHYYHYLEETDEELSDCFSIVGVALDENGQPIKDASGNYVWDDSGTGGEIWGHLHRSAWEQVIQNNIQDENGNILSIAKVLTSADGQALIEAINDQRTGTATINANRIKLNATDTITLDALLGIEANTQQLRVIGDLYVDDTVWATDISALSSIHSDITIDAPTIEGGYGRFQNLYCKSTFDQYGELTGGEDVSAAFKDMQFIVDPQNSGHFILQGKTLANPNAWVDVTNFNIAATQYYINGVAAAYTNAVNRVSWPTPPRSLSSFIVNAPTSPWNASTETGTTENRIFELGVGAFDSNYISVVDVTMKHNENGQAVTDGVVAEINVDASSVYSAGDSAGYSRGYTRGMNDVGVYITKNGSWYTSWTIQAGDSETFYPAKWINGSYVVDYNRGLTVTASGGGTDSSNIDLANAGQIWLHSSDPGSGYVNLGSLGSRITEGKNNGSAYVSFQATCDGGTTYKYYKIPL